MRILFVCPTLECGGAERCIATLANYWAKKGWQVTILTIFRTPQAPFYSLDPAVSLISKDYFSSGQSLADNIAAIFEIREQIQALQPDRLLSFVGWANIVTLLAGFGLQIPIYVSERTNLYRADISRLRRFLIHKLYPLAKQVVVQTNALKLRLPENIRKRTTVIPNPVSQELLNHPLDIDYSTPCIVAVGRLENVKGFDLLLKAFREALRHVPGWSLKIFGRGPERDSLERLIGELELIDSVSMHDPQKIVSEIYSQGSIFALSSRAEGYPNALLEACACGLAVVSMDCNFGPAEIVENKESGLLVGDQSAEAFSQAMITLMRDADLRKSLGKQAQKIAQKLSTQTISAQWEEILTE